MSQEYIEVTERTVSEAITVACQKLAVPSDRLEYEVIDPGKTGFLGIGARPAKIRVRVKKGMEESTEIDTSAIISDVLKGNNEKKKSHEQHQKDSAREDRKDHKKSGSGSVKKEFDRKKSAEAEKSEKKKADESARAKAAEKSSADKKAHAYTENSSAAEAPAEKENSHTSFEKNARNSEKAEGNPAGKRSSGRREYSEKNQERGYRDRGRGHRRQRRFDREDNRAADLEKAAPQASESQFTPRKKSVVPNLTDEQIAEIKERADSFLKDVLQAMDLEAEICSTYEKESGMLNIDIKGENMGVLIGKRGQTLDSLQYLVSLVVNKGVEGYIHVKADTENYRERRKKTLENLAKNIAGKVKKNRASVALEPMNPYERRIIHSALQSDRYVTTYSQGEEPYRKVIVTMKEDK